MTTFRAQCVFPYFTGLPEDVITNTLHFWSDTLNTSDAADQIASRLSSFFSTIYEDEDRTANFVDWDDAMVKVYNLDDSTPRVPEERALTVTHDPEPSSVMPTEVAVVASFHAAPPITARRRNRIYLGGFSHHISTAGTLGAFPMVLPALIIDINTAMLALQGNNSSDLTWVGVSQATGSLVFWAPVGGWVDNTFDTQRRRGIIATSRTTWAV